ncbi:PAS domain-containing protein [Antrihabitans cavernicola]|uniref:PAS domain-containing protein n=1 Tax=Antrihabitans cavernicola TaxID=2495913 RepID=UPI00165920D4
MPVLAIHREGFVVYANAAFADMLGYRCVDLTDICADRLLTDPGPVSAHSRVHACGDSPRRWSISAITTDGRYTRW